MKALLAGVTPVVGFALQSILVGELGVAKVVQCANAEELLRVLEIEPDFNILIVGDVREAIGETFLSETKKRHSGLRVIGFGDFGRWPKLANLDGLLSQETNLAQITTVLRGALMMAPEGITGDMAIAGGILAGQGWSERSSGLQLCSVEDPNAVVSDSVTGENSIIRTLITELAGKPSPLQITNFSDPLTGVANRRLFVERAESALKHSRRMRQLLALVYIDLRQLSRINERLGYDAGDKALIEIGRRLTKIVREIDTVARLGSDEFALVLVDIETRAGVGEAAERVQREMALPVNLPHGNIWEPEFSMGVAISDGNETLRELIARVDSLMARVKRTRAKQFIID
ncbi:GGDEF domain-containing protein [Teredinibacter turnerae]|uniref:GGDEF domain-containing protein n=1 Tax=Teredinibacter turnerae TaxID=2426 RepID=UPI0003632952|nr:GGDEF domain-containing protein [Teredinibacter turnerae]